MRGNTTSAAFALWSCHSFCRTSTTAALAVPRIRHGLTSFPAGMSAGKITTLSLGRVAQPWHKSKRWNTMGLHPRSTSQQEKSRCFSSATPTTTSTSKSEQERTQQQHCIYLDYNGTTPVHPLVLAAMMPFFTQHFGNPSSAHHYGTEPARALEQARAALLALLLERTPSTDTTSSSSSSIWFTSCGTESDNLAIQLALQSNSGSSTTSSSTAPPLPPHIVTSNIEHPAVEVYLQRLERQGRVQVTYVPVQSDGRVSASDVTAALQPNTILVTLMLANNEIGSIQPVADVARECRRRGILCHTDAAQAVGKISVSVASDNDDDEGSSSRSSSALGPVDLVTIVGHKMGAPKGVAALYVRDGCLNEKGRSMPDGSVFLHGGGQEFGRRGGTENVPYIVGMGRAAFLASEELNANADHMESMRCRLLNALQQGLGSDRVRPNGPKDPALRLPNTLSVGIAGVESGSLLRTLGDRVAASAGAACHSSTDYDGMDGSEGVSSVLRAMRVPVDYARGTLRLSVGPSITPEEIDDAAALIIAEVKKQWQS